MQPTSKGQGEHQLECDEALELDLRQIVDDAVTGGCRTPQVLAIIERVAALQRLALEAGWKPEQTLVAIERFVVNQGIAYLMHPDPADDPPPLPEENNESPAKGLSGTGGTNKPARANRPRP